MRSMLYPDVEVEAPVYLGLLTELSCDIIYDVIITFSNLIAGDGNRRLPWAANTLVPPLSVATLHNEFDKYGINEWVQNKTKLQCARSR